jgi:hypothetical protein
MNLIPLSGSLEGYAVDTNYWALSSPGQNGWESSDSK